MIGCSAVGKFQLPGYFMKDSDCRGSRVRRAVIGEAENRRSVESELGKPRRDPVAQ